MAAISFFEFEALIPNHIAMFSGIVFGILSAKIIPIYAEKIASTPKKTATKKTAKKKVAKKKVAKKTTPKKSVKET